MVFHAPVNTYTGMVNQDTTIENNNLDAAYTILLKLVGKIISGKKNLTKHRIKIILYFMVAETLYNTKEIKDMTGETNQRLTYWILKGVVVPADPSLGTGTSRKYSLQNLMEVIIAQELSRMSLNINIIKTIMEALRNNHQSFFQLPSKQDLKNTDKGFVLNIQFGDTVPLIGLFEVTYSEKTNDLGSIPYIIQKGHPVIFKDLTSVHKKVVKIVSV